MLANVKTQAQLEEWLERNLEVLIIPDDLMPDIQEAIADLRYGLTAEGLRALKAAERIV